MSRETIQVCPYCASPMPTPVMTSLIFGAPAGAGVTYTSAMTSATGIAPRYEVANCGDRHCTDRARNAHRVHISEQETP